MLNGIDASLLSQKRLVKVRQSAGATITDMYDHLKPLLKRHPEFIICTLAPIPPQNIYQMRSSIEC